MTTPLYPTFKKRVEDAVELLIQKQVTPWSFLMTGHPLRIKYFNGKEICYQGVGFSGSPREVFWSRYIEPFLEDFCISEIAAAVAMAKERGVDAKQLLLELQGMLLNGVRTVYVRMANVDRGLMAKGYPDKVHLRSVDREIQFMEQFLNERIQAEIMMCEPAWSLEEWYKKNQFWVWACGLLLTALIAAFFR